MKAYLHETIEYNQGMQAKVFVTTIDYSIFHFHSEIEILLVLKGGIDIVLDKVKYRLTAGEIFVFNSLQQHEIWGLKDNLCLFIQINEKLFNADDERKKYYFEMLDESGEALILDADKKYNLLRSIARLGYYSSLNDRISKLKSQGFVYDVVVNCFMNIPYYVRQKSTTRKEELNNDELESILTYIQNNFLEENISDKVSKEFGLSERTLYRYLKSSIGLTIKEIVTKSKIVMATKMLKKTDNNIAHIAMECGFGSEVSFFRVFKKEIGKTPSEFRRSLIEASERNGKNRKYLNFGEDEAKELLKLYCEV